MKKKEFEAYLNALYAEQDPERLFEEMIYLTNKQRKFRCTESTLRGAIASGTMGTLLRKFDSIAFEVEFNNF